MPSGLLARQVDSQAHLGRRNKSQGNIPCQLRLVKIVLTSDQRVRDNEYPSDEGIKWI